MNRMSRARLPQSDFLKDGTEAFVAGRFNLAANCFEKAHRAEPRDPIPLFNLASARERLGDIDEAAACLTRALRVRANWAEPAKRLSVLTARYTLQDPGILDPYGLLAAFSFEEIDRDPLAKTAMAYLRAKTMLGGAVHQAAIGNARDAARAMLLKRTDKTLTHPLLHAALTLGINRDPNFEKLLTAMRRVILMELDDKRYEDKTLVAFACALLEQCFNNEHVFAFGAEEAEKLKASPVDWEDLLTGSTQAAKRLLWQLLYHSPDEVVEGRLTSQDCRKLRPRGLAEVVAMRLREDEELAAHAATLPSLGAIRDHTSLRMGQRYHDHPYPRWRNVTVHAKGSGRRRLERFVSPERLTFFDASFKVLIAGAGTGRQAIVAALRYGSNAEVLAIDLSRRSLAYGLRKAAKYDVPNLHFAQGDLLALGEETGPFHIIESIGVLHHLADPLAGLRALAKKLRPGGLMLVGLYSDIARRNIARLRDDPAYPGAQADDDAARRYRGRLVSGGDELLLRSHDFYTLCEFRDLVLHDQETPSTLLQIEKYLREAGLIFRGFLLPATVEAKFTAAFQDDSWPGTLANWHLFEEQNPRTFDSMYQFWCEKS
jgi:SAM-dependent methyltransferase/tetratricopeptide (TPR) repeat protein